MWTGTDWTVVGTQVLGAVGIVSAVVAYLKKRFPKEAQAVENAVAHDVPAIALQGAKGLASIFVNLAKMPMFAGLAAKGELQAHHIESHLMDTHLALAAANAVGVFNSALDVKVDNLSPTQKTDIVEFVKSELQKVGITKTNAEIVQALQDAQKTFDNITQTIVPAVQQHDAAVQAWSQPAVTTESV